MPKTKTRRLKDWALVLGFWTLLALSFAVREALISISEHKVISWQRGLAFNLTGFYLWMLLTPFVRRFGDLAVGHGWKRFFGIHIPASIVLSLVQTTLMLVIYWPLRGPGPNADISFAALYRMEFIYSFHIALMTYWVLMIVLRGMESRRRLKNERLRAARLETQLAQSQLQALRMQLQPHFLFNTLNSIAALTLSDPSRARSMIARLSDFLRLTLEERHLQRVPLSRELQFLNCYLGIQRIRFTDRLETRLSIAEDTLNASIPNLLLQPLVENALRHGLLPKSRAGTLTLTSHRDGGSLRLIIEDDGLGLPENGHREGIGLTNTRARLKAMYGGTARLDLTSLASGGTRVELSFPFEAHAA